MAHEKLTVSADRKFLCPPGSGRVLVAAAPPGGPPRVAAARVAAAGADALLLEWPFAPQWTGAARAESLAIVADAGAALNRLGGGLSPSASRDRDGHGSEPALWIVHREDLRPSRRRAFGRYGIARLSRASGVPVAGFLDDERTGRGAPEVVVGRVDASDPERFAASVTDLHLAARRRPVVVEPAGAADLGEALGVAADLGAAGLLARSGVAGSEEHLDAVATFRRLERRRFADAPLVTVVVCVRDAAEILEPCLRSLLDQRYPRIEVLVVDDGSSDGSAELARAHGVSVVASEGAGLSAARNTGARAARGEIVAYIDADAEAHPDWIAYLWRAFERRHADGVGGPNLPFDDAGLRERAVSGAPGAAVPVVDRGGTAEHLNGTNMAFRRSLVREIGFEEHRPSSEDVAFGLAALERGARLVFHPTAMVDHHRRATLSGYLRQQRHYGAIVAVVDRAEGLMFEHPPTPTRLRSRLNPLKRRYVFSGAQEAQLYVQRAYPVNVTFPLKVGTALGALSAATAPLALLGGWQRRWALTVSGVLALFLGWVAASVPAFAPRRPTASLQRLLTALLWLAQPVWRGQGARSSGRTSA